MTRAVPLIPIVFVAATAFARGTAAQQRSPEVFGVDVRVIAVPVFVTDKDGRSIAGLARDDFEVEDQGRTVSISGFLEVDAAAPPAALPAGTSPALAAASRRQFLLLFDQSFSTTSSLLRARQAALKMLSGSLQPGDLIAVAALGPAGLRVLTGFTTDRAQAAGAVAAFGSGDGARLRDPLGLAYDLGLKLNVDIPGYGVQLAPEDEAERDNLFLLARREREHYRQRVAGYLDALGALGRLLDSVRGRKQVILLSSGFDASVLLGASGSEQAENASSVATGRLWEVQGDRHFGSAEARGDLDRLYAALARSDTVVHTVDLSDASTGVSPAEGQRAAEGTGRETLAQIAGRSGGLFVRQTADIARALTEVLAATRHYYVVAFEPADPGRKPGEPRKLKVKVKRAGLSVSHRASYTVPADGGNEQARQLTAAEVIAKGLTGGALRLSALPVPYRGGGGPLALPVVLEIDGESLLAGAPGASRLSLEVYGYAFDGRGRVLDALGLTPSVDLQAVGPMLRSKGLQVLTSFRVEPGPVDLRFLVRDTATDRAGSLRLAANVPAFDKGDVVLSPPLLMDDPRARLVIPAASRANPQLAIPFRVEDTAFTPQAAAVLHNGRTQDVCVMVHGMPDLRELRVTAELDAGGANALAVETGPLRTATDSDGLLRLVAALTARGVPAGDYRLRLKVNGVITPETAVRVE